MTRLEYDALIAQKNIVNSQLEHLNYRIEAIAHMMGKPSDRAELIEIAGGEVIYKYREAGCACHPSYERDVIPEEIFFSEEWPHKVELWKAQKANEEAAQKIAEELKQREAADAYNRAEYERLKAIYGEKKA